MLPDGAGKGIISSTVGPDHTPLPHFPLSLPPILPSPCPCSIFLLPLPLPAIFPRPVSRTNNRGKEVQIFRLALLAVHQVAQGLTPVCTCTNRAPFVTITDCFTAVSATIKQESETVGKYKVGLSVTKRDRPFLGQVI